MSLSEHGNNLTMTLHLSVEGMKQKLCSCVNERADDIQKEFDLVVEQYFQGAWREELAQMVARELESQLQYAVKSAIGNALHKWRGGTTILDQVIQEAILEAFAKQHPEREDQ